MSVSSEITRLENAKTAIKTAIKGKGVAVPDETKVDGLATLIDDIFSPEVQEKSVVPSKTAQTVTPDSGKLLSKVSVAAITSTLLANLDSNFKATNIRENVNMFGLVGTLDPGVAHTYGFWRITFPTGSSCKIKKENTTYSAPSDAVSLGRYAFPIPSSGSWTATCTDGTKSATKTISFSSKYVYAATTLSYSLKIYDNGTEGVELSTSTRGGGEATKEAGDVKLFTYAEYGWESRANIFTTNTVDITAYSKLTVSATRSGQHLTEVKVRDGDIDIASVAITNTSTKTNFEIDVSSLSGSYTIGVYASGGHGTGGSSSATTLVYSITLS